MLTRILKWLGLGKTRPTDTATRRPRPGTRREPKRDGAFAPQDAARPSRNRTKYFREDTGTHETLKILDDSIVESADQDGFDPYNTGDFDRSRNWERRFRD